MTTGQGMLERLVVIRDKLNKIIDDGMEMRFVDMQQPIPLEIEFDLQNLEAAFTRFYEHGQEEKE